MDPNMVTTAALKPMSFLVGGEWVENSSTVLTHINPATGEPNYQVCSATLEHVEAAVESAYQAVTRRSWRQMWPHDRASLLHRFADLMMERVDLLARYQMLETGKVWKECRNQVVNGAATFRFAAAAIEALNSEITPPRGNYVSMTVYEPWGVVVAITPSNSPITLAANKIAAALAAGNAVVLKPSPYTPACGLELGRIAMDAGLPPGIVSVLTGSGADLGESLINHPRVQLVSFTGGTKVGRQISEAAGKRIIPAILELGGKSPHIVFPDADLAAAADAITVAIFEGTGQSCTAGSRLFLHRRIFDEVLDTVVAKTRALRVDLPDAPNAQLGPLTNFAQREFVEQAVEEARRNGAKILIGGSRPSDQRLQAGAFYMPTIAIGVATHEAISCQELFGPVLTVFPFDDEEEIVRLSNDSPYGLAAGIWTADYKRAWRVARELEAGMVWINTYKQFSTAAPFGGFKSSGLGREKGVHGIRAYQQAKTLFWSMADKFDGGFSMAK
jgi:betaine-aldehyde dehydrogenase